MIYNNYFASYKTKMSQISIHDMIGTIGVIMVLIVHLLLQIEKIHSSSLMYSIANLIGGILVILSLMNTWNLSSFIIEVAWCLISIYGIYRYYRRH